MLNRPDEYPNGARVLMVTPIVPWDSVGGTATVSKNLIQLFSEHVDLRVCCLRSDELGVYPREEKGVTILSGGVSSIKRKMKLLTEFRAESFADRQFQRRKVISEFSKLVADLRPAFIIFDHIYSGWLINYVDCPKSVIAYVAHDDMIAYADSLLEMKPPILQSFRFAWLRSQYLHVQRKILQRCDFLLALTSADKRRMENRHQRGPTEIAPLFFDFPNYAREYTAEFRNLLVTGSFDTWEKQKGLMIFINEVFVPLIRRFPELRLVLAGRFPQRFRQMLSFPQLEVINGPSPEQMQAIFRRATAAAVLDLQASGLKIKTIELAGAGLPIVSWSPGLEGTNLEDEKSCLLARSAAEFGSQLTSVVSDPDLRRRLGMQARATMEAEFFRHTADERFKRLKFFETLSRAGAIQPTGS